VLTFCNLPSCRRLRALGLSVDYGWANRARRRRSVGPMPRLRCTGVMCSRCSLNRISIFTLAAGSIVLLVGTSADQSQAAPSDDGLAVRTVRQDSSSTTTRRQGTPRVAQAGVLPAAKNTIKRAVKDRVGPSARREPRPCTPQCAGPLLSLSTGVSETDSRLHWTFSQAHALMEP